MPRYEVYATRWDDPKISEELIPTRNLEMTFPLSDHGECSFSATVEPGRSFWRPAIAPVISGVLVCRDNVPVWSGMVWSENQTGPRTFDFQAAEWGSFFERVPAGAVAYLAQNDHTIFRNLIDRAQAVEGQDVKVTHAQPLTLGSASSDLTVNTWDDLTVEAAFRSLAEAEGGPEWYFNTTGTLENPGRTLVLGDRLGRTDAVTVLEYVEDIEVYPPPSAPPQLTLLGNLFPGVQPQAVTGKRGGNVIAHPARARDGVSSATVAVAIGAGEEAAQLRKSKVSTLIAAGYPRLTRTAQYNDVSEATTLQRHADADLGAVEGLVTSFTLSTLDDEPDWTQVTRGDSVRVILETDVYGTGPVDFETRLLGLAVQVQDAGAAAVNWSLATTLTT